MNGPVTALYNSTSETQLIAFQRCISRSNRKTYEQKKGPRTIGCHHLSSCALWTRVSLNFSYTHKPPGRRSCLPLPQCRLLLRGPPLSFPGGNQITALRKRFRQQNNWGTGTLQSVSLQPIIIMRGQAECPSPVDRWASWIQPGV